MPTQPATAPALSPDQQKAHDVVLDWWRTRSRAQQILTFGGYAGTGKTTTLAKIAASLRAQPKRPRLAFCCFTGKAALVLRSKLWAARALEDSYCGTIHGLIYKAVTDGRGRIIGWRKKERHELEADAFILDEASMVDSELLKDLQSYGLPILAVGDHGQLPPVSGTLNLMENPEIRLETIHRQAIDNPIVRVSLLAREGKRVPHGQAEGGGGFVRKVDHGADALAMLEDPRNVMVICGTNRTRQSLNAKIRTRLGYDKPEPSVGEKVICLRNNRQKGIFNGMLGVLKEIAPAGADHYSAKVLMDGDLTLDDRLSRHQFGHSTTINEWPGLLPIAIGERFDWGWAVTCHKAQGSESRSVLVYEECDWMKDAGLRARWLYTAYTRAAERLIIVGR